MEMRLVGILYSGFIFHPFYSEHFLNPYQKFLVFPSCYGTTYFGYETLEFSPEFLTDINILLTSTQSGNKHLSELLIFPF